MKVPTVIQLIEGRDGILVPTRGSGSASTLPMSETERKRAGGARKRNPLGFAPPEQTARRKRS